MLSNKITLIGILIITVCLAFIMPVEADVWVEGYYKDDGTYVEGHWRSDPDGNPYNNWSYPGNLNPYTGEVADGNPSTYLKNYNNTQNKNYPIYKNYSPGISKKKAAITTVVILSIIVTLSSMD